MPNVLKILEILIRAEIQKKKKPKTTSAPEVVKMKGLGLNITCHLVIKTLYKSTREELHSMK